MVIPDLVQLGQTGSPQGDVLFLVVNFDFITCEEAANKLFLILISQFT